MTSTDDALTWWTAEVAAFRSELERLECIHLDTSTTGAGDIVTCADFWIHRGETFVDVTGNYVGGTRIRDGPRGWLYVSFATWKTSDGRSRPVVSIAERTPFPQVMGPTAAIARHLLRPVLHRLLPKLKPFPLRTPADVREALATHLTAVAQAPGAVLRPPENPLEWRWRWESTAGPAAEDERAQRG